jgi:trehalose 6-phosphate synthase
VFFLLPWANEILDAMLEFDLVGFHTHAYAENFLHCVAHRSGVQVDGYRASRRGRMTRVAVFPLGISATDLETTSSTPDNEVLGIKQSLGECQLVLGVDRLDYTKGIPERIDAFGRLLEVHPEWRRRVCLVQVSVPSRAEIDEYAEQKARIENSVGRINGAFGEADWVPIRYLYRSYGRAELNELYRTADVGYVTPLRDGMNLVAKEFVAAQDPMEPGVLLLSRFAGAAEELTDALLTNPWDQEGVVHDLDRALRMPLSERRARHASLLEVVSKRTSLSWAQDFVRVLTEGSVEEPWSGEFSIRGERSSGLWIAPGNKAYTGD